MKKNNINFIKVFIILTFTSLIYFNCQKESAGKPIEKESSFKTVSLQEAEDFFIKKEKNYSKNSSNGNFVTPLINKIYQNKIPDSKELVTIIPSLNKFANFKSKILLLKFENEIKSVVVNFSPFNNAISFSGFIVITDLEGNFITGARIKNNKAVSLLKLNNNYSKKVYHKNSTTTEWLCTIHTEDNPNPNCYFCNTQNMGEVVIVGNSNSGGGHSEYIIESLFNSSYPGEEGARRKVDMALSLCSDQGGGGDHSNNKCKGKKIKDADGNCVCPNGYIEDQNGNCVMETPCKRIKNQIEDVKFKAKINELQKLTGKKQETGYAQNKDGTFTKLNPINNGHSLDMKGISVATIDGYIHTHLNDFPTGEIDPKTGQEKINQIYRIFSPADIIKFLQIVKVSQNPEKAYATVITSTGDYTLKFTGNKNDIKGLKTAKLYKKDYIREMKKGRERGFLHFLKNHIKIEGIELYKLHKPLFSSTIKIQRKKLNDKGKVDKVECE